MGYGSDESRIRAQRRDYARRKSSPVEREKDRARKALRGAIERGAIIRPSACSACGVECRPEGHHPDYAKRLDVVWLCIPCHRKAHGRSGQPCKRGGHPASARSKDGSCQWCRRKSQ